jgi:hypothetical protein
MSAKNLLPTLGILSITDGRLMRDIGDIYEVLSFLVGRPVFTHELPRYSKPAGPILAAAFPDLAGDSARPWEELRDEALNARGEFVEVPDDWRGSLADGKNPIETIYDAVSARN